MSATHFIYVITAGCNVKVGFSSDPQKRLRQVSRSTQEHCLLARALPVPRWKRCQHPGCVVCARNWERTILKQIVGWRGRGEWYSIEALPRIHELIGEVERHLDEARSDVDEARRMREHMRRESRGLVDTPHESLIEECGYE